LTHAKPVRSFAIVFIDALALVFAAPQVSGAMPFFFNITGPRGGMRTVIIHRPDKI